MKVLTVLAGTGLETFRAGFARLGEEGPSIMAGLLNAGGLALRTRTVAKETEQTGLKESTVDRAQVAVEASPGRLSFSIQVEGGNIRLKHFGAQESGGGVTARPWNRPTFYPGAFITSGRQGARAPAPKLHGQVYRAKSETSRRWGRPITQVKSGLFLPDELVKGETIAAWEEGTAPLLDGIMTRLAAMV